MQEIHALDLEVRRLKEAKVLHKEYRRYVEMPSKYKHRTNCTVARMRLDVCMLLMIVGVMSRPCPCCHEWIKRKHQCSHAHCEKPCKKHQIEQLNMAQQHAKQMNIKHQSQVVVAKPPPPPKPSREMIIQQ